ncbi:hypothetical protein BC943DRAFT_327054 [Umbelopsis sp. AD052]|nr:hypothetical protein BC943DRAFT_327054 [Umbelopsis sp. AD052]
MKPQISVDYLSHSWNVSDLNLAYTQNHRQLLRIQQNLHQLPLTSGRDQYRRLKTEHTRLIRYQNALWRQMAMLSTDRLGKNNKRVNPSDLNWQKDSDITWLLGPLYCSECENDTEFQERCARSQGMLLDNDDRRFSTPGLKPALKTSSTSFSHTKTRLTKSLSPSPSTTNLVRFDTHVEKITFQAEYPTSVRSASLDHTLASEKMDDDTTLDIGTMMEFVGLAIHAFISMLLSSKAQIKPDHRSDTRTLATLVRYCRTLFSAILITAAFTKSITMTSSYQYRQAWKHRTRLSKRTIRFE